MKISLNWLKEYVDIPFGTDEVQEWLTSLGLEVEGLEQVTKGHNGLRGIVVGHVKACEKHPDADKLSCCKVDIGAGDVLSIVCGAPNVATGQKVLVATQGAEVIGKDGSPFTIKKGRIRGADSEGMICAEDELGLGHDHAGIMVLDGTATPGTPAALQLGLKDDYIIEIGLTPNRSDATCHIGVARDLLAAMKVRNHFKGQLCLPTHKALPVPENAKDISIHIEHNEACRRYAGIVIEGISVGPSPEWLRTRLEAIGERSINNIVDVTNYVLHEWGQPLHAFDLDKIGQETIRVACRSDQTPFVSLDGITRALTNQDLMICDGNYKPMCMAGVFGGLDSGVSESTVRVFLESAWFDPKFIRRSSTKHNLRTEAARIFEKGADPEAILPALHRAASLILEVAGGSIGSKIIDIYPEPIQPAEVQLTFDQVKSLTGVPFTTEQILSALDALEMTILDQNDHSVTVRIPGNKSDVNRVVDVIEEILRIYGYDNIPEPGYIRMAVQSTEKPDVHHLKSQVSAALSANGFSEAMNLSLDQSARYEQRYSEAFAALVKIHNTANVHLDSMRFDLLPNMMDTVLRNQNRQQTDLRLYEWGKTYQRSENAFQENNRLLLVITGRREPEHWLNAGRKEVDFYTLKGTVTSLLQLIRVEGWQERPLEHPLYSGGLMWTRGTKELVRLGLVHQDWAKDIGVDSAVWVADFDWDSIIQSLPKKPQEVLPLLRFPVVRRDLAIVVDKGVSYADMETLAKKTIKKSLLDITLFDVFTSDEHLGPGKKSCALSFRFAMQDRTLTDHEIDKMMDQLIQGYENQFSALIRK